MGRRLAGVEVKKNRFMIILKSRGMSIQKLADATGYTRPGLSKAMNTGKMDSKTLDDISRFLDVSPEFFTGEIPLKRIKPEKMEEYMKEPFLFEKPDPCGYAVPDYHMHEVTEYVRSLNGIPITELDPVYGLINQAYLNIGKSGVHNPKTNSVIYVDQNFIDEHFNFLIPFTVDFMELQIIDAVNESDRYVDFQMDSEAEAEAYAAQSDYRESFFETIPADQEPEQ